MKTKEEFVTETLIGYIEDPTTCSIDEDGRCQYQTEDGRKCAFGKHLREYKKEYEGHSAIGLLSRYSHSELLTDEAIGQDLSPKQWDLIQYFHDKVSESLYGSLKHSSVFSMLSSLKNNFNCEFTELEAAFLKKC